MKLKRLFKMLLITIGVVVISLTGCGADEDKETKNSAAEMTGTLDEEVTTEEDENDDGGADAPASSPGDKDTGEFAEEDVPQTALEDIGGEGMVDEAMPNLAEMKESPVEEPVMFVSETGTDLCLFAIESVESSDMKIENMGDVTDKKVVVVSYSYTNRVAEENLLFDDMSFKLLANDTVCMPYFSPKLTPAAASGVGETAFGQVAFLVPKECSDVIIVVDNTSVNAKTIFKAMVE